MIAEVKGTVTIEIYENINDTKVNKYKAYEEFEIVAVVGKYYILYGSEPLEKIKKFLYENYIREENYITFDHKRLAVTINETDFDGEELKQYFMYGIEEFIFHPHLLTKTDMGYVYDTEADMTGWEYFL